MQTDLTVMMNTGLKSGNGILRREVVGLPAEYRSMRWYAAYTSANHEKRVAERLGVRGVEHFLPTFSSVRQWKDRRVALQMPLFPGYVFVRIALGDRLQVHEVPSVVRLVAFNGVATPLPEEDIEGLRRAMAEGVRVEPHPYLKVGRRVRVTAGPFVGFEGILKRCRGGLRVVLAIELIQRSVLVDVEVSSVVPIGGLSEYS